MKIILVNPPPLFPDGSPVPVQVHHPPLGLLNIAAVLEKGGYKVFVASDDQETMDVFNKENGNFQLIFSDVVLPNTNGIKLVENLLKKNSKIKIVLTSGYTDQKSQWQIIKEKGYPYLQKPYTFENLLKVIGENLK